MKNIILKAAKIILVAMMITILPGVCRTVSSDESYVGREYALDGTLSVPGNEDIIIVFKGSGTSSTNQFYLRSGDSGQFSVNKTGETGDTANYLVEVHISESFVPSVTLTADKAKTIKGLKIIDGDGSENSPYEFAFTFEPETVPVTFIIGDLCPAALADSILSDIRNCFDPNATMSGTTISCSYPVALDGHETIVGNLYGALGYADTTLSRNDETKQYWLGIALQTKDKYSSTDDISAEWKAKQEVSMSTMDSVTVYGLWKETVSAVKLTIEKPLAGTQVTCTAADGFDQSPVPTVTPAEPAKYIVGKKAKEGLEREDAYWRDFGTLNYYSDVTMEEGKSYTVYAGIRAPFGYIFAGDFSLIVNGEPVSSNLIEDVALGDDSFYFYYDIETEGNTFYPSSGDSQTWKKGSSSGLSFTFAHSGTIDPFTIRDHVEVDGSRIEGYDEKQGSWIITLKPEYLETLSEGKHTLKAVLEDKITAEASFTIQAKDNGGSGKSTTRYTAPKTGID